MSDFCLLQVVVQAVLVFGQVCKPDPGVLLFVLVFVLFLVLGWGDDLFHLLLHFCLAAKFFVLFLGGVGLASNLVVCCGTFAG